jgi:hypothetical protein
MIAEDSRNSVTRRDFRRSMGLTVEIGSRRDGSEGSAGEIPRERTDVGPWSYPGERRTRRPLLGQDRTLVRSRSMSRSALPPPEQPNSHAESGQAEQRQEEPLRERLPPTLVPSFAHRRYSRRSASCRALFTA